MSSNFGGEAKDAALTFPSCLGIEFQGQDMEGGGRRFVCFCRPSLHPPPSRLSLGDSDERKEASLHIKGRRRRFVCCLGLRRTGEGQHRVLPNGDGENCISPVYFCFWESARRNFLLAPGRRRKEGKNKG